MIITLAGSVEQKGIKLTFRDESPSSAPPFPVGYSQPLRAFRVDVRSSGEMPQERGTRYPGTMAVALNSLEQSAAEGDLHRMVVLHLNERSSSWLPAPSAVDYPWIRAEVNLDIVNFFVIAVAEEGTEPGGKDRLLKGHPPVFDSPEQSATATVAEGPGGAEPVPVLSPTETPRTTPVLVAPLPTAAATEETSVTANVPPPETAVPIGSTPSSPHPIPSPPPSPTAVAANTPTPTAAPVPAVGHRLYINGRQVLADDERFLVPLGAVTIDPLPGPGGTYRAGAAVALQVEIGILGGEMEITGADSVAGVGALVRMDRDRFVRIFVSPRATGRQGGPDLTAPAPRPSPRPTIPTPGPPPSPTERLTPTTDSYPYTHTDSYPYPYTHADTDSYPYPYTHTGSYTLRPRRHRLLPLHPRLRRHPRRHRTRRAG